MRGWVVVIAVIDRDAIENHDDPAIVLLLCYNIFPPFPIRNKIMEFIGLELGCGSTKELYQNPARGVGGRCETLHGTRHIHNW